MSRASNLKEVSLSAEDEHVQQDESIVLEFEEIDRLTDFAIAATDIKK